MKYFFKEKREDNTKIDKKTSVQPEPLAFIRRKSRREEKQRMKAKTEKKLAKGIAKVLETTLKVEANSTSCFVMYQPKVPKELSKYRRMK